MVTFHEYLEGFRNINTEEQMGDAFYKDIDISICMRDDDMPNMWSSWDYNPPFPKHVLPSGVEFMTRYEGIGRFTFENDGLEIWVFIIDRQDMLLDNIFYDDYDGYKSYPDWYVERVDAISGHLFKIRTTKSDVVDIISPPSLFDAILYETSNGEDDMPASSRYECMPYFVEHPITTSKGVKKVEDIMNSYYSCATNMVFGSLLDVPEVFRSLYIRRNSTVWNAANLIASKFLDAYMCPYTKIGMRRLDKSFAKLTEADKKE